MYVRHLLLQYYYSYYRLFVGHIEFIVILCINNTWELLLLIKFNTSSSVYKQHYTL